MDWYLDCNWSSSFASTNQSVWLAVGVTIGAALSWQKPKNKKYK